MDDNQHTPVNDDQELANVLAGMNQQATAPDDQQADDLTVIDPPMDGTAPLSTPELQFEDAPLTPVVTGEEEVAAPVGEVLPTAEAPVADAPAEEVVAPAESPMLEPEPAAPIAEPTALGSLTAVPSELDDIKKDALEELRPLVSKLELPADEKFDTLLLIIRSTDDKTLVNATFEAAKAITDETKRAQALLDVIKEIDYFSGHGEQPAA